MNHLTIVRITLFSLLVIGYSYIFFGIRPDWVYAEVIPVPELNTLKGLLPAIGVFIFGLLFNLFLDKENRLRFLGDAPGRNLLIAIIPIILLTLFGVPNEHGFNKHYWGLILGLLTLTYALFEETGWRGYLQKELQIDHELIRYGIIGFIWWFWHWQFLADTALITNILLLAGFVFASLGIGRIAEKTNSVLVCAAFHSLGNIAFFFGLITMHVPIQQRLLVVLICLLSWFSILKKENEKKPIEQLS